MPQIDSIRVPPQIRYPCGGSETPCASRQFHHAYAAIWGCARCRQPDTRRAALLAVGATVEDGRMVAIADATAERWDDLVTVMGTRGEPPKCWCQWFRHGRPGFYATSLEQRRTALQSQVEEPIPPGVLAYDEAGAPSGWCAVAPRADYPRLTTYPMAAPTHDEDGLWAVTCFVVRVGKRRTGLAEFLLDGAVDLARRHGARLVEAYPLDTSVRAASAGELRHGPLSVFLRTDFREVGARPAPARPVVRLELEHSRTWGRVAQPSGTGLDL